eukprot:TRINITY_DN970_c0_g1_i1.p1 TRINITY_DN970_c0_g1~~TRINITY_DN970_c0_g1_i1.p1  ORF type:complete len:707 (-),score=135.97 TRINITY_DN970_c0_g1_i1:18-2138(-)
MNQLASALEKLLQLILCKCALVDICLVIDGSASVSEESWKIIVEAIRLLLQRFDLRGKNSPHRLAIVQFSDEVKRYCDLLGDAHQIQTHIDEMTQMRGGTQSHLGVEEATRIFSAQAVGHKVMIIITDGHSEDNKKFIDAANKAKLQNAVEIIAIGVGDGANVDELRSVSDALHHFHIKSMEALHEIFHYIGTLSHSEPTLVVSRKTATSVALKVTYDKPKRNATTFVVEMFSSQKTWTVVGEKEIPDPDKPIAVFVVKELQPNTEYEFRAFARLQGNFNTSFSKRINLMTLEESPESKILKDEQALRTEVNRLRDEINNWCIPEQFSQVLGIKKAKIALFGRLGNGKSTWINSLNASMTHQYGTIAITNNSDESVTTTISAYNLIPSIEILDTWGWGGKTDTDYENTLGDIICGHLGDAFEAKQEGERNLAGSKYWNANASYKDRIHGVIMFYELLAVSKENNLKFKEMYDKFVRHELQPVVVLTKADRLDSTLIANPQLIFESDEVDGWKDEISKLIPNKLSIHYGIAHSDTSRSEYQKLVLDYLALKPLHKCIVSSVVPRIQVDAGRMEKRLPHLQSLVVHHQNEQKSEQKSEQSDVQTPYPSGGENSSTPPSNDANVLPVNPSPPREISLFIKKTGAKRFSEIIVSQDTPITSMDVLQKLIEEEFDETPDSIYKIVGEDEVAVNRKNISTLTNGTKLGFDTK